MKDTRFIRRIRGGCVQFKRTMGKAPVILALYSWIWCKALTVADEGEWIICRPFEVTSWHSAWVIMPNRHKIKAVKLLFTHPFARLCKRFGGKECDIRTATGRHLDALARIPVRPAGMSDQELRARLASGRSVL